MIRILYIFIFFLLLHPLLQGQTCCSGGVPISSNLGFTMENQGTLHISMAADFNTLSTLYDGSRVLANNNRERNTNSYFLRLGYDLSSRFSIESLLPFIVQKRKIRQNNGSFQEDQTKGIGDIVLLTKYQLFTGTFGLSAGLGFKLANASFSETNSNGLLLINDLQPGSGSFDYLLRLDGVYSPKFSSTSIYSNLSYQLKGSNDEYLGSLDYRFGNEVQVGLGFSRQVSLLQQVLSPSLGLRYRSRTRDQIDDFDLDNTGGKWLFVQLGIGWNFTQNSKFSIQADIPIYQNIDGTQLSNDYVLNVSFYQKINVRNNEVQLQ